MILNKLKENLLARSEFNFSLNCFRGSEINSLIEGNATASSCSLILLIILLFFSIDSNSVRNSTKFDLTILREYSEKLHYL